MKNKEQYLLKAKYLLKNTNAEIYSRNDPLFTSRVNLAVEELSIVTGRRDATLDIKHITGLLELCLSIDFPCRKLYISDRTVTSREVIYTLNRLDKDISFNVLTELEGDIVHTGILKDFTIDMKGCEDN